MAETEPNLEQLKPAAEPPPFTGFLYRLLAFVIDCVLLYFIFKGLDLIARPALLALNPALPWLGHVLVFLYFWIGYGPLTRGQTAAKALLNIRVVDRAGQPISWGAAARRALLQQVVFAVFFMRNDPDYLMIFPARGWFGANVVLIVLGVLGLTTLVMLAVGVIVHPYKRGWHDLWAGSFVTGQPIPYTFRQVLDTPPDVVTERKMANFVKMTLIFWVVITVLILYQPLRGLTVPQNRRIATEMDALRRQYSSPPYLLTNVSLPSATVQQLFNLMIQHERERARTAGETVPTTESLRAKMLVSDQTLYSEYYRRHGAYAHADLNDPALRQKIEALRAAVWQKWQASPEKNAATTSGTLEARTFTSLLFEPLALVMYNGRQLRGRAHGPADPAQGKLIFEDVLSPLPEAADQKTTATASPEALRTHETPRP